MLAKKIVSEFLLPLPAVVLLLIAGVALLWFTRRQRLGKILVTAALGVLVLFSFDAATEPLLGSIETRFPTLYPQATLVAATTGAGLHPRWVVVLGSGHTYDPNVPPTDQLSATGLARLTEGVRLYRALPGVKLLVSGGVGGGMKHGHVLAAAARSFGVPAEDIVVNNTGRDTEEEARAIVPRLGHDDFLLVTSGYHMTRSVALFRKMGADPIPAPTDHVALDAPGLEISDVFPRAIAIVRSERALHEIMGTVWGKLLGKL